MSAVHTHTQLELKNTQHTDTIQHTVKEVKY